VLLMTVDVKLGARVSVEVEIGIGAGASVEIEIGIGVGAWLEVEMGLSAGVGFGKSTLHDKLVSARIAATRDNGIVLENLSINQN
jgi:hypothetical protein